MLQTSAGNFALFQAFRVELAKRQRETGKNTSVGTSCKRHILLRPLDKVIAFVEKKPFTVALDSKNLCGIKIGRIHGGLKDCKETIIPNLHVSLVFHCFVICMHCVC